MPAVFLFNVVLSRLLGATGVGVFQLTVAIVLVASTVSCLGIGTRLLRDVARATETDVAASVASVYWESIAIVTISAVVVTGSMLAGESVLSGWGYVTPAFDSVFPVAVVAVVPVALLFVNCRFLAGVGLTTGSVFFEKAALPLAGLCFVPLLVRAGDPRSGAVAYVLAASIAALGTFAVVNYSCGGRAVRHVRRSLWEWTHDSWSRVVSSSYFFSNELLLIVLGNVDLLILGLLASQADVGIFNAILRLTIGATWVRLPIYTRIAPRIVALAQRGKTAELEALSTKGARTVMLGSAPFLGFLLIAPHLSLALFGKEFSAGANALVIVVLGKVVEVIAGPTRELLLMTGHEREVTLAVAGALGLQVLLGILLVPRFGLIGAAATNVAATVALALVSTYYVHRRLSVAPSCIGGGWWGARASASNA